VSAISFWEVAILVRKNRFRLATPPPAWRDGVLRQGIVEVPLDGATATEAPALSDFHADPADQLIVASAIRSGATLLTADERILQWRGQVSRQDARL
jgi:PIN domain nuclease of toxin-antitoxin system